MDNKIFLNVDHFVQNIDRQEYLGSNINSQYGYNYLNNSCCALACLQMCIKYYKNIYESLLVIFEKSLKFNVIDPEKGALHYNLVKFAKNEYNLNGCLIKEERKDRFMTLISFLLKNNILILASVKQGITNISDDVNNRKSGHIVLIVGIDNSKLYINDPDNVGDYSEMNKVVDIDKFFYNFSGNLICISN